MLTQRNLVLAHSRLPQTSGSRTDDITAVTSGMYIVRQLEQEQGHEVHLHSQSSPDLPSCNCMDWRRHCLPCKHILAIVVHAEGWKSLPLYDRSIRQFSLDPVTAPTEEAETVPAPQELTVGTQSPASDQTNAYTEEPSVGTQSPASDQPNAYTEEPSVGTQSPASDQPNAYTEEPSVGTQSPATDQPTAYTEEPSVGNSLLPHTNPLITQNLLSTQQAVCSLALPLQCHCSENCCRLCVQC